jgi:hypothetical protein
VSVPDRLARIVSAHWFTTTVLVVIVVNAVVLGLETYAWIDERYGDELELLELEAELAAGPRQQGSVPAGD